MSKLNRGRNYKNMTILVNILEKMKPADIML